MTKIFVLIFLLFLTLNSNLCAVSLSPELVEKLKEEGRLEEVVRQANLARKRGVWQPNPHPPIKLGKDGSISTDTLKPIVICVDFDDNEHTYDANKFDTLLFSKNFAHPTGSMRDYYLENSYGKLDLVGGGTGWYRMPQDYSYYVWEEYGIVYELYPHNAQRLTEYAVDAADPYVNFADYDHDEDGWVDGLIIVHAGPGAEETVDSNHIWSHKWNMRTVLTRDGVKLYYYCMGPEVHQNGNLADIGVFAHEFGHILGAIDLYDTDYTSKGLGKWSVMAYGTWNNDGKTPAHFDAWHKCQILGFSEADQLTTNQTDVEILQAETSPVSYRLWTSGEGGSQYFLVENRQKVGFDSYLPEDGLLIYHVDEIRPDNKGEWCPGDPYPSRHYKVALEQADAQFQLEGCYGDTNRGDAGDPFPGYYNKRAFDDTTIPSSRDYYDNPTQVAIRNISDSDSVMTCDFFVSPVQADDDLLPHLFLLKQNYPNPFNPETKIGYKLRGNGWVKLEIFNILGQKIFTLVDGHKEKDEHIAIWDGRGKDGKAVSSGIYFYKLTAGSSSKVKKMVLLK